MTHYPQGAGVRADLIAQTLARLNGGTTAMTTTTDTTGPITVTDETQRASTVYVVMQKRSSGEIEIGAIYSTRSLADHKAFDRKTRRYGTTPEPFTDAWVEAWRVQGMPYLATRPAPDAAVAPPSDGLDAFAAWFDGGAGCKEGDEIVLWLMRENEPGAVGSYTMRGVVRLFRDAIAASRTAGEDA